ncbi:hypothetical protein BDR04DRAFT_1105939 [Suillus decipiens]|nr:hypothetical protein BDR04DRAFT_1105939 [Suillus decipiens]
MNHTGLLFVGLMSSPLSSQVTWCHCNSSSIPATCHCVQCIIFKARKISKVPKSIAAGIHMSITLLKKILASSHLSALSDRSIAWDG